MALFGFGNNNPAPAAAKADPATPVAADPAAPATPATNTDPLAAFSELWSNDPNAAPVVDSLKAPLFANMDETKFQEAVSGMNFTNSIDPALVAKAQSGDTAAFLEAINQAGRAGFSANMKTTMAMVEQALAKRTGDLTASLPGAVKNLQLRDGLDAVNPAFTNPALKPMVEAAQARIASKFPKASVAEIQKMTNDYMTTAAQLLNPQVAEAATTKGGKTDSFDWGEFFAEPS